MSVIALFNRKGGVGKTSLCFHLAGAWAAAGRRVLCLDMDPQASLSQSLLGPAANDVPHIRSLAALFDLCWTADALCEIIHRVDHPMIDLAPAGRFLGGYNHTDPQARLDLQEAIARFVADWRGHYDRVLIDCPPCLQLCSWASLLAADQVLVPVIPSDPGVQGLAHVRELVAAAQARFNPRLRLAGYVLSMVQRNFLHRGYADLLRGRFPGQVLHAEVPRATVFEQAVTARVPVPLHRPRSAAARAIVALAAEIDARGEGAGAMAA